MKIRSNRAHVEQLRTWATGYPTRTWPIEGAEGLGFLLAQQLVSAGERVVDVPATLAARTRDHRTRLVCRLHSLLAELAPGGIAKEINASDVDVFLDGLTDHARLKFLSVARHFGKRGHHPIDTG